LDTKPYSNIVRGKDKMLFGWFTTRTILCLAKEFKIGDWIKNGCQGMPYAYWFSKENLFHDLGIKDNLIEQEYYRFLNLCAVHGVFSNQQDELNIYLEYPDMMKMVDETQMKESLKKLGKGKLTIDDVNNIVEDRKTDSRVSLEHSIGNDIKTNNKSLSNTKDNTSERYITSSSQAPSDKGSDDINTYAFGQQVVNDVDKTHREYEEVMQQAKNL